jgi:competence protein ComEA
MTENGMSVVTGAVVACAVVSLVATAWARVPRPVEAPPVVLRSITIDINKGSAAELSLLPEIGPRLAGAIVLHRSTHGPFGTVDDLRHVRGIGPATIALLKPYATVTPSTIPVDGGR